MTTTINKQSIILGALAFAALSFAQDPANPQTQPPPAQPREAIMARRQAMRQLTTDFATAVKNGGLTDADRQKADAAVLQLQPPAKGAPRDPKGRHDAMRLVRQMSSNPALKAEDRAALEKDLAVLAAMHRKR